jgi:hypothetical protein
MQPEPRHVLDELIDGLLGAARQVRVLDAQEEPSAGVARQQPVEQRGARPVWSWSCA